MLKKEQYEKFAHGVQKKLTIAGDTKIHETYKVPLNFLYYNEKNGRIATYIEEYNATNKEDISKLLLSDKNKYNDIIADFIKKSSNDDEKSFNNTKKDIKQKLQKEPGVILTDGRIIDGNRRFTAIRELYKETGDDKFAYFETVILNTPENNDKEQWKSIKSLELNLQFNVDEKRDYNKIDFLVSFYKDVMDNETKIFDKKQYCYAIGMSDSEFKKNENIVLVMLDYLEWRNKAGAFYILKNEKLDGPLEELGPYKAKMSEDEWNEIKDTVYSYMTLNRDGDRTRDIRELLKSAKKRGTLYTQFTDSLFNKSNHESIIAAIQNVDKQVKTPDESKEKNEVISKAEELVKKAFVSSEINAAIETGINAPLTTIKRINKDLEQIRPGAIEKFNSDQKNEFIDNIDKAIAQLDDLKNKLK